MNIYQSVERLRRKHNTRNPFNLARCLNIEVVYEELGSIDGYYNKVIRMKQIHLNNSLSKERMTYACAHELGHAILHPNAHTPFLREHTLLNVDKLEIEADAFAADLLISDELLIEAKERNYTDTQLARLACCRQALVKLRLQQEKYIEGV